MNLKSRLFGKPAWEHKDPEVRARAAAESDDAELQHQLPMLAQHDEAVNVRLAALKRINTEPFWLDARLRESDEDILRTADDFLARAVMRKPSPDLLNERLEWFARMDRPELVRNAAQHAPDERLRAAALERIESQGFLGDCYMSETSEALAARLLERIDQESTLHRIVGKLRKTSKKRARAAEQRLAVIAAASGHDETVSQIASRLIDQVEALARGAGGGDRKRRLAELETEWQSLTTVPDTLQRRYEGAARIVRNSLERATPPATEHPSTQVATDTEPGPATTANVELATVAARIRQQVDQPVRSDVDSALLSDWDRAWNAIDHPGEADHGIREEMLPLLRRIQKRHETAQHPPEKQPDTQAVDVSSLNHQLDEIGQILESGELAAAHESLRRLRERINGIPASQRPEKVLGRQQRMEGRFKEMRNWQHWSNNKIRDELIAQVEHLAESDQHPDAISAALKDARAEWQRLESLEVLPGDKRRFASPPGQWRRFQAACKEAFEKARPFFEKRHEVQEQNLETLDQFIDRGMAIADGDNPDSAEMLGFMRKARQAIRRLDDIPSKSRGKAAGRLKSLMDRLSQRLDESYEAVESAKRRLVAEARELTHEKDLKAAIDKAKALQARWQQAGSGRRRIEQKLWKEFREPIDPLFEQLEETHQERRQEQQEAIAELEVLCKQAEELAELDAEQLPAAEGRMRGLNDDWYTHARRPQGLDRRFAAANEKLAWKLAELRQQERDLAYQELESLAQAVQKAWQQRLEADGQAPPPPADLPRPEDDPLAALLSEQLDRITSSDTDQAELESQAEQNGEAARQIAVEMEFLAGVETPRADQQRRMDYQVKRLARQLGERGSQLDLATELEDLHKRWYAALPLPPDHHEALAERFGKCRKLLQSMLG